MPCALGAARAQDRTIHVIVPLLAGSGTDVVTRTFVAALSQRLGQPIVVENKAGGATALARRLRRQERARRADAARSHDQHAVASPQVQKPPYDTQKDLAPIAGFSVSPLVFGTSAESKHASIADMLAAAKAKSRQAHLRLERHRHPHPHGGRAARCRGAGQLHPCALQGRERRVHRCDRRTRGLPRRCAGVDAAAHSRQPHPRAGGDCAAAPRPGCRTCQRWPRPAWPPRKPTSPPACSRRRERRRR